MKLIVERGEDDPRSPIRLSSSEKLNIEWLRAYWTPSKNEIKRPLWGLGLLTTYQAPTNQEFGEVVTSFIPKDSIVYARFSSHLGEIPSIVEEMDRQGLHHEAPHGDRGFEGVLGEVNKEFVFTASKENAAWESEPWDFLVANRRIEGWTSRLDQVDHSRVVTESLLDEAELFQTNGWEHGVEVFTSKLIYGHLQEMAVRFSKSLNWELEIK